MLTVGTLIVCWILDLYLPLGWEADQVTNLMRGTGLLLIVVALALDIWTLMTFRKFNANFRPDRAATTDPDDWALLPIRAIRSISPMC